MHAKGCHWENKKEKVAMCMCMCVSRSLILGENDDDIDAGDGNDELVASIIYLTYLPYLTCTSRVAEWQSGRGRR